MKSAIIYSIYLILIPLNICFTREASVNKIDSIKSKHFLKIDLQNGTGKSHIGIAFRDFLMNNGYETVELSNYPSGNVSETTIYDRTDDMTNVQQIAEILGINQNNVNTQITKEFYYDITIILEKDYKKLKPFIDSGDYFYYFNSNPYNAEVIYRDSLLGITPLRFYSSQKLNGIVVFEKNGFKDYKLDLESYYFDKGIEINLEPLNKFNLVEKGRLSQFSSGREYHLVFGSVFLTLISGFAAVYFKNMANNSYGSYQNTLNQSDLDKSRKYDIYSGIGLAVMQLAFAGLIYFLFLK